MDERLNRYKFCDAWLYPYLDRVFLRLPANVREEILNNEGFQIISNASLTDICGDCFHFDQPLKFLVYLNPALALQPDHRLECAIAMELANFVALKEQWNGDPQRIQELLISWGFENEVNAVCFCSAVAGSKAFREGYAWAQKQNEDYLMLHFGIYYDEWNLKGLVHMSEDRLEKLRSQASTQRLLPTAATKDEKDLPEGISAAEVRIEGIMAAVKELKLRGKPGHK
jgi:hypothetical protein